MPAVSLPFRLPHHIIAIAQHRRSLPEYVRLNLVVFQFCFHTSFILSHRSNPIAQAVGFVHTPVASAPGSTPGQPPIQTTRTQETGTAPAKLAHRTRQQPRPKAATGTDAQMTNTFLCALSYPHLPTAPHVYRMFHRCHIGHLVVAITRWSILGDDLRDRHTPPLLDVQREHEAIPVVKAIGPTLHLGIAAPLLIDARTIFDTALIARRVRFPRLS